MENPCKFSSCTGLCLLHHGLSNFTCNCENFIPTDENHWCNKNSEYSAVTKSDIVLKNYIHTSTEISSVNFTPNEMHRSADCSSVSIASPSILSLQSEYLIASGVIGFVLGISIASFVILVCYIFQKYHRRWGRKQFRITEEMEM